MWEVQGLDLVDCICLTMDSTVAIRYCGDLHVRGPNQLYRTIIMKQERTVQ